MIAKGFGSLVLCLSLLFVGRPVSAEFLALSLDNDLAAEIEDARDDGKRLVVMFEQEACPWCLKMRERVFPEPRIDKYFSRHFVMLQSDIRGDLEMLAPDGKAMTQKEFARQKRVRATPVFLFFDLEGKDVVRVTGFQDAETFLTTGRYVVDEIYKTGKSLARYQQGR